MEDCLGVENIYSTVEEVVDNIQVFDIHTHLYGESFGELLLYGIDEMLDYHYLLAESYRYDPIGYDKLWSMTKQERANWVFQNVFLDRSPISEAGIGLITCLQNIGVDFSSRSLDFIRKELSGYNTSEYIDLIFKLAKVKKCVMTNNPFDDTESALWDNYIQDDRFLAALRIDSLLLSWDSSCQKLKNMGYSVNIDIDSETISEVKRFIADWCNKINPIYMAASLPPNFNILTDNFANTLIKECVLPMGEKLNLPFAMMIGVKKLVNPDLRLAGDSLGRSDVDTVEWLCRTYPNNKFMLTNLAREDQQSGVVAARKFANLHVFGCWWFCNTDSIVEEITRMRLELLGTSVTLQHSDARVLDQLIYKWQCSRRIIVKVLSEKYTKLIRLGWYINKQQIIKDTRELLGGSFEDFLLR